MFKIFTHKLNLFTIFILSPVPFRISGLKTAGFPAPKKLISGLHTKQIGKMNGGGGIGGWGR